MSSQYGSKFDKFCEQHQQILRQAADGLMEHFDTVQLLVTKHVPEDKDLDGTVSLHIGRGNYYARFGQVIDWLTKQDEYTRDKCRGDESEEDEN